MGHSERVVSAKKFRAYALVLGKRKATTTGFVRGWSCDHVRNMGTSSTKQASLRERIDSNPLHLFKANHVYLHCFRAAFQSRISQSDSILIKTNE